MTNPFSIIKRLLEPVASLGFTMFRRAQKTCFTSKGPCFTQLHLGFTRASLRAKAIFDPSILFCFQIFCRAQDVVLHFGFTIPFLIRASNRPPESIASLWFLKSCCFVSLLFTTLIANFTVWAPLEFQARSGVPGHAWDSSNVREDPQGTLIEPILELGTRCGRSSVLLI